MNERHLLVNSITLLYCASQLAETADSFKSLVRDVIVDIKIPEVSIGGQNDAGPISSLRKRAMMMATDPDNIRYNSHELLQGLKVDTGEDIELFDAFERGIQPNLSEDTLKQRCVTMSRELSMYIREKKVNEIISRASYDLKFKRDSIKDIKGYIAQICTDLEPFQNKEADEKDPAIVAEVDFGKPGEIAAALRSIQEQESGASILKTGWQGLNRMLRGGFRRGDEVVIGALQHQYKTGFTLSLFRQIAMYNVPHMIDPKKKPLLLRISFEDSVEMNIEYIFNTLKHNEDQCIKDDSAVPLEEKAEYVKHKMEATGYHIKMIRVNPTMWGYRDVCNYCLALEAEGYEIHLLMLDYLAMMPTTGCSEGPMGSDVRDMFRRMRNFTNPRKITLLTPHQLSTEAKMLIREGRQNFVQELPGKGYYDKCRTVDNEVDIELFIHIEKVNGSSYLTIQRGKHRLNGVTPAEHLYMAIEFMKDGSILDDFGKLDTTLKKPGGTRRNGVEEKAFWDED